jgi:flavin reductase (DIM6/NTAB) family NADH-FMN oxidoreductase RutF
MSLSQALGKIASGLYIATARLDGEPIGMLCSFVEQAGFEPPMISLAIGRGRPLAQAIEGGAPFGLHVLSKSNHALLKSFARGCTPESFANHPQVENSYGVPQFAEAWAFLVAKVVTHVPAGDHILYVAEALSGAMQSEEGEPMVRIRSNGLSY